MSMFNLVEYTNNYSKTSENLRKFYRDEPAIAMEKSKSFKFKIRITGETPADGNKRNIVIAVPLKYISSFWRTLEMPVINCEFNIFLT